ncbi:MAG: UvrD-helicase domain-containing protein [Spirochaetaceae bacterium]|jgi:uncharacterized protein (TIGR00375 family)|nr:UvrD-helicase domain-containing protein [Spirochaetaceae bacterium]
MRIIADLHIHSRFSRATSAKLTPPSLERWARIKGINLLGTGDCTHPRWLAELRDQLEEAEEGFYTLREAVRAGFDAGPARTEGLPLGNSPGPGGGVRFVLTGEISTIYKRGDKTRKVHHLIILPNFAAAGAFQTALERRGNIGSDGRPILGIDSRDLLALLLDTDDRAILIPAHIWTPWFSVLGAKSGFDSIEECYGDLTRRITAIETGLSSNPPMNWALAVLDRFSIVSNSDAHSPDKLGREATVFEMAPSYPSLRAALGNTGVETSPGIPGIVETVEFFPQEGKYHYDGHRKCGVCPDPKEAVSAGGLCPVCGKPLTRGVMGRVLELADRPVREDAPCPSGSGGTNRRPYRSLIPLKEILGELLETGTASKRVEAAYAGLIEKAGSELSLLMDMPPGEIGRLTCAGLSGEPLREAITRMRSGEVIITPGYDGEYGIIRVFPAGRRGNGKGGELFEIPPGEGTAGTGPGKPAARPDPGDDSPRPAGPGMGPPANHGSSPAAGEKPLVPDREQAGLLAYDGDQALIIAGPGAGKTAALTARIVRLIREGRDPAAILALSFTAKAAAELRDRITRAAGAEAAGKITAATFHSLCASILREQSGSRGIPRNFSILGEGDRQNLLAEICGESPGKRISPQGLGNYIEGRKRFLLLPGEDRINPGARGLDALAALAGEMGPPEGDAEKERLYGVYRDRLRAAAALDFDDLAAGTARLLAGHGDILLRCRDRFRFIFVDEYQDINFSQYALIRLLAPGRETAGQEGTGKRSLWVIGDPNQAIYGFRGSDKRFIGRFLTDYPGAAQFRLTKSFRCAAPIIAAAGRLVDTPLGGTRSEVSLFRSAYPTEKSEAEGIARRISRLIGGTTFFALDTRAAEGPAGNETAAELTSLGDCAVLLRAAALARPIVKALLDHGIPFDLTGDLPWWEEEPVKSLLALLRGALYPEDESPPEARLFRDRYLSRGNPSPAETVRLAWDLIGPAYKKAIPGSLDRLRDLAALHTDLPALLDTLKTSGPGEVPEPRREGVRIMTIHASKGLEFDQVFVAALEEGLLPFTLYEGKTVPEARIEEERRLLYVAMTRAKRGLYLSWARSRNYRGRKLTGVPSRFLESLGDLVPPARDERPIKRDPQPRLF